MGRVFFPGRLGPDYLDKQHIIGAALVYGRHSHAGFVNKRTLVFTDSTPDAEGRIYSRFFKSVDCTVLALYLFLDELDSLPGSGAVFFAHSAVPSHGVRYASVLVEKGHSDADLLLFLESDLANRPGRADLRAEVAVILAVAEFRY